MRFGLILIVIEFVLGVLAPLSAKQVSLVEAEKIALNWMHSKYPYRDILVAPLQKQLAHNPSASQTPAYYTISFEPKGWAIVSAESAVQTPIVGYSLTSPIHPRRQPPGFVDWMRGVSQNIKKIQSFLPDNAKPSRRWTMLSQGRVLMSAPLRQNQSTYKLLSTPTWSQGQYYNELTPDDNGAKVYTGNNHVPTGCVATTMAEIMRYHKWPKQGKGSHTDKDSGYGNLYKNFSEDYYDWDDMPDSSLTGSNDEVAQIMFDLGVATDMQYTPAGSGTFADSIIPALTKYFSYDVSIGIKTKNNENDWVGLIKNDIDNDRPILYAAFDDSGSGGHAFVCEGYDLDNNPPYLHFNWGWDGLKNGWFALGALNIEDTSIKFNTDNTAFFGVSPINKSPKITSIEPSSGIAQGMGITVKGKNFYTGTNEHRYITVGEQKVPITQWTNTMITFNAPAILGPIVVHNKIGASEPKSLGKWQQQNYHPSHPHASVQATAGNKVYFFGDGENDNEFSESIEMLDSSNWNHVSSNISELTFKGGSAVDINDTTIYIAGINNKNDYLFDTTSNSFTKIDENHSVPNEYGQLVKINDVLYYVGGQDSSTRYDTNEVYKRDDNSWVPAGNLSKNRSRFTTAMAGDTLYIFGGKIDDSWYQKDIEKCSVVNSNLSCEELTEKMPDGYIGMNAFVADSNTIVVFETDNGSKNDPLRAFTFSTTTDKVITSNSSYTLGKLLDKFSVFKQGDGFVVFGYDDSGSIVQFAIDGVSGNSDAVEVPTIESNIIIDKDLKVGEAIMIDVSDRVGELNDDEKLVLIKQPMLGDVTINGATVKYKAYSDIYSKNADETIILRKENGTTKARSLKAITVKLNLIAPPINGGGGGGGGGGWMLL